MTGRTFIALVASVALTPTLARAQSQFRAWNNYCTTGAFQLCASVQIALVPFYDQWGQVNTAITLKISNLEGLLGTTPWGIVGFQVRGLAFDPYRQGQGFPVPTFEGSAQAVEVQPPYLNNYPGGPPGTFWGLWNWYLPGGSPYTIFNREVQEGDGAYAITGCDPVLYGSQPNGYLQTCSGGWVVYSFVHFGSMQLTDNTQIWINSRAGTEFSCTFGVECVHVVPEPGSILLLGTGLVGMGAFRCTRRRRVPREWRA